MKNSEQPIYPCIMQKVGENEFRLHKDGDEKMYRIPMAGLTKREYFAGLAMQGILQNLAIADKELAIRQRQYYTKTYPNCTEFECVAKESIGMADELLKQLSQ